VDNLELQVLEERIEWEYKQMFGGNKNKIYGLLLFKK